MKIDRSDLELSRTATRAPGMPWTPATDLRLAWVGGHLGELFLLVVFTVLAVWVSPGWWLAALVTAVGWLAYEVWLISRSPSRGGALTSDRQAGTDTASPNPAAVRGGDVPGERNTRGSA